MNVFISLVWAGIWAKTVTAPMLLAVFVANGNIGLRCEQGRAQDSNLEKGKKNTFLLFMSLKQYEN